MRISVWWAWKWFWQERSPWSCLVVCQKPWYWWRCFATQPFSNGNVAMRSLQSSLSSLFSSRKFGTTLDSLSDTVLSMEKGMNVEWYVFLQTKNIKIRDACWLVLVYTVWLCFGFYNKVLNACMWSSSILCPWVHYHLLSISQTLIIEKGACKASTSISTCIMHGRYIIYFY